MAIFCVKPTASGTGTGASWANALGYNFTPARGTGNTYYFAGGTYSGDKSYSVARSGNIIITLKKATVADHGTGDADGVNGWLDTMGTSQAVFNGQIQFTTGDWDWNGVTGGGPDSWLTGFGFKVVSTTANEIIWLGTNNFPAISGSITLSHFEAVGNLFTPSGTSTEHQDGVAIFNNTGTVLVRYFWIHECGRCPFIISGSNTATFEYGYTGKYRGGTDHSEVFSTDGLGGLFTWRYNIIAYVANDSTGGLMIDCDGASAVAHIHGSVFARQPGEGWAGANNAGIGSWDGANQEKFRNVIAAHNSFVNLNSATPGPGSFTSQACFDSPGPPQVPSNNQAYNNLLYSCVDPGSASAYTLHTSNHFISTSTIGTNATTGSGNPFVDVTTHNYRLTANTPAGASLAGLPASFAIDMFGNTRTTLTRGAVEFATAGPDVTPPSAPTGLTVV